MGRQHQTLSHAVSRGRDAVRSQHFLRDGPLAEALVAELRPRPGRTVVEIGAGRGIITQALAERGFHVIAVEKDARLFRSLRSRFIGRTNVECHHADILGFALPRTPYDVVSNVPYAISADVVRRLLDARTPPDEALLILQREAAEKFAGTPQQTLFSLLAQPLFAFEIIRTFARTDFAPAPGVDSVLLRIRRRERPLVAPASRGAYRHFATVGFRRGGPDVRRTTRPFFSRDDFRRMSRAVGVRARQRPSELTFAQGMGMFRFYELVCLGRRGRTGGIVGYANAEAHGCAPRAAVG
jgi:23S rRNA (adenine-N6)-dimethyltransferase